LYWAVVSPCSASDVRGNTSTATFTVTVRDTTPPVIVVPANIVVEATAPVGNAVSFVVTATDDVDPNPTVVCTPASGSIFAVNGAAPDATTVNCTATDNAVPPNSASASFTVRVQDTTPPVISNMPANITVPAAGGGAIVTWASPTALDIVDLVRLVTCAPASGSFFPVGITTTVTCTASDTRGNSSQATFTVTVTPGDTTPPEVCLTLKPGKLWPPNHKMRQIAVILTVRDNEDPNPTCAITSVTSTEPVTGKTYGNFAPDWNFNGLFLELRAERYSKQGRTYTVSVLCSDDAGNTRTVQGTVKVPHDMGHGDSGHYDGKDDDLTLGLAGDPPRTRSIASRWKRTSCSGTPSIRPPA
jgi:hypothetical protein